MHIKLCRRVCFQNYTGLDYGPPLRDAIHRFTTIQNQTPDWFVKTHHKTGEEEEVFDSGISGMRVDGILEPRPPNNPEDNQGDLDLRQSSMFPFSTDNGPDYVAPVDFSGGARPKNNNQMNNWRQQQQQPPQQQQHQRLPAQTWRENQVPLHTGPASHVMSHSLQPDVHRNETPTLSESPTLPQRSAGPHWAPEPSVHSYPSLGTYNSSQHPFLPCSNNSNSSRNSSRRNSGRNPSGGSRASSSHSNAPMLHSNPGYPSYPSDSAHPSSDFGMRSGQGDGYPSVPEVTNHVPFWFKELIPKMKFDLIKAKARSEVFRPRLYLRFFYPCAIVLR